MNFDLNARLAYTGSKNEPVLRRLSVDKTARKFRELLCSTQWDLRLIQWLHGVLIDYLPSFYLAVYIDILQVQQLILKNCQEKFRVNLMSSKGKIYTHLLEVRHERISKKTCHLLHHVSCFKFYVLLLSVFKNSYKEMMEVMKNTFSTL